MMIYFLEKLRKIFKSIGKKERKIINLINYLKYKKKINFYRLDNKNFNFFNENIEKIKIASVITFFFDKDKIQDLVKVCSGLNSLSNENEIHIFTNNISSDQAEKLKKEIKINVNLIIIDEPVNDRLLPWYHINLMKKLYVNKDISHFLYLEDDIYLSKSNFNYWINSRKILKKFGLIPGFIRTENNKSDNQSYAIDFLKRSNFNLLPKISVNDNYDFINNEFPYQGMYLYDRDLMTEHLSGPSSNPDCGHGAFDLNFIDDRMINQDLMAKANIGLTYINPPYGFFNRIVIPFDIKKKRIAKFCEIKHLSNRYSNTQSSFGNVKVEDAVQ